MPSPKPDRQRFLLVLQDAAPDDSPVELRLRRALKVLLRSFGLRCSRIEPLPHADDKKEAT